jgi:hypothetical protein
MFDHESVPKVRAFPGSLLHAIYDFACVCIDAIFGRYDRLT